MVLLRWVHWICKLACLNGMKRMFGVMNGPLLTPCTSFMQWALASTQNSPHVIQFSGKSTHWKKGNRFYEDISAIAVVVQLAQLNTQMDFKWHTHKQKWKRIEADRHRLWNETKNWECAYAYLLISECIEIKRDEMCVCVGNEIIKKRDESLWAKM